MARPRSAKQVAASRRNLVKARASRKRRVAKNILAVGVGTGVVLGSAVTARKVYNNQFETYYHGTSHHSARQIVKHGYDNRRGSGMTGRAGEYNRLYMVRGYSDYGHSQLKIKVRKRYAKKIVKPDYNDWPLPQYYIHSGVLKGARARGGVKLSHKTPKRYKTRAGVRHRNMYGSLSKKQYKGHYARPR